MSEDVCMNKTENSFGDLITEEQDRFIKFCNHDYSYMNLTKAELEKITNRYRSISYDYVRDIVLISLVTLLFIAGAINMGQKAFKDIQHR